MKKDKSVKLSEAVEQGGCTDRELLNSLSEEDRHCNALADADNPPLSEEQLKEFQRVDKERG